MTRGGSKGEATVWRCPATVDTESNWNFCNGETALKRQQQAAMENSYSSCNHNYEQQSWRQAAMETAAVVMTSINQSMNARRGSNEWQQSLRVLGE